MALDKSDLAYLDAMYVRKDDCNRTVAKENEKIADLTVLTAKQNTKLSILIGILSAIAVPVLALCVKLLFGN